MNLEMEELNQKIKSLTKRSRVVIILSISYLIIIPTIIQKAGNGIENNIVFMRIIGFITLAIIFLGFYIPIKNRKKKKQILKQVKKTQEAQLNLELKEEEAKETEEVEEKIKKQTQKVEEKIKKQNEKVIKIKEVFKKDFDKDGNGVVDIVESSDFIKLLKKHQKLILKHDKEHNESFTKIFIDVSSYLELKKKNIQQIFNSIIEFEKLSIDYDEFDSFIEEACSVIIHQEVSPSIVQRKPDYLILVHLKLSNN